MTAATAILAEESLPQGNRQLYRYSKTSDSAIPFVRQLPSHWRVEKLKHVASVRFSSVNKKTEEGESLVRLCNYTDVYNRDTIVDDPEFMQASATAAEIARHTLRKGDVLITKDSEAWNDIAVPAFVTDDMPGVLCGYHLAHIRPNPAKLDGAFLTRAFASDGIRQQFHVAANGITRYGLPNRAIAGGLFPIPPLNEQRAIAAFLDRETTKIDELIAKKVRLIELIQKKRTALISHAVTKGLDPAVPLKDSGVEWLGQIPEHWTLRRVKYLTKILRGKFTHRPRHDPAMYGGHYPFIQTGEISQNNRYVGKHRQTLSEAGFKQSKQFPKGTLVMTITGAGTANVAILDFEACFPDSIVGFVPSRDVCIDYLYNLFIAMRHPLLQTSVTNTQPNLNIDRIGALLTVQPLIEEQNAIVRRIDEVSANYGALIAKAALAIKRLGECRTALISSAVTGQIDVRNYRPEAPCQ
jgi:type I restriction enzyme, S subunit